jgi:hypothetical protein
MKLGLGKNGKHIFFAIEKKKETRSKSCSQLDFFAPVYRRKVSAP